jgi:hypothetical protein
VKVTWWRLIFPSLKERRAIPLNDPYFENFLGIIIICLS